MDVHILFVHGNECRHLCNLFNKYGNGSWPIQATFVTGHQLCRITETGAENIA